ncbi:hypothetical protein H4R24_003004 [Coemansia sp. RSA 988]|nr:hypothetical protein H4R24_003004 [Coemansia sp. RSA 988]
MAQTCMLDEKVVARIVNIACYSITSSSARLHIHKQLIPLAAVNRTWRRLALTHITSALIVECQAVPGVELAPFDDAKSRRKGGNSSKSRSKWKGGSGGVSSKKNTPTASPVLAATTPAVYVQNRWKTNARLLINSKRSTTAVTLRIQCFDASPNYESFVASMEAAGLQHCDLSSVTAAEIVDLSEMRTAAHASVPDLPRRGQHEPDQRTEAIGAAAAFIAQGMPNVSILSSTTWSISAANRALAASLAIQYYGQLQVLSVALAHPIPSGRQNTQTMLGTNLTTLQIQARILEQSGRNIVPAAQLQTLKLFAADAFFSWEPFASSATQPDDLEFSSLTTLSIDFEKDDAITITDFYNSLSGSRYNVRVSMGRDRRRILLPQLHALSIRKLPYTYSDAWRMFTDSPIQKLAVAGRYAHARYIDPRLLHGLALLDIHTHASEGLGGKYTSFVRTLLAEPSSVTSAWLRHAEAFPLSVPESVKWTQLVELNISAYMPSLLLLALVRQLPSLCRLIVQRIACDIEEQVLELSPDAKPWGHLTPPSKPASMSVRELQLHMGGGAARTPTLQAICFLLLCMPHVRLLAIKQCYWDYVRAFVDHCSHSYPDLAHIELIRHLHMQACSPFLILG